MEPAAVIASLLAVTTVVAGVAWAQRGRSLDRATAVIHGLRDERMAQARTLAERGADQGALLDALDEGVIRVDAADRVTEADRRAHLLLGYEPGALLGRSLMEAFMDPAVEALATRTRNGSTGAMTVELRPSSPDGTAVTVRKTESGRPGRLGVRWLGAGNRSCACDHHQRDADPLSRAQPLAADDEPAERGDRRRHAEHKRVGR